MELVLITKEKIMKKVEEFFNLVESKEELNKAIQEITNENHEVNTNQFIEIAKAYDFELTKEELMEFVRAKEGGLSDEELDEVSAGADYAQNPSFIQLMFI